MSERICSIDDCGKPRFARGWCSMHYQRWLRNGDPLTLVQHRNVCSIEDCSEFVVGHGWCRKHYSRWQRHGDPLTVRSRGKSHPIIDGHRVCAKCLVSKPLSAFNKSKSGVGGHHPWCRECRSDVRRALYATDPERYAEDQRWRSTKWKYGITRQQYDERHEAQGGLCAICGASQPRLAIDHDHSCCSGQKSCGECLRGLLCFSCNSLLGLAKDDPDRLLAAVAYLRRFPSR